MPTLTHSPLAQLVKQPRDVANRASIVPWGVCVHTTGSGVPEEAARLGVPPLQEALSIYLAPDRPPIFTNFPHYVIDNDGTLVQLADEVERARHVAIPDEDRAMYLSGAWRSKCSATGVKLWDLRWGPGKRNPLQLYPSRHPNDDYLGVELIPLAVPLKSGSRFTSAQYDKLSELLEDIEQRYGLELEGSRLVGHEDISPLTRWNSGGGWDPGGLRGAPSFLWREVQRADGTGLG